jgi:hypothetical protein
MIAAAWCISIALWTPWIFAWPYIEGARTVPENQCYIQFLKTNHYITIFTCMFAFYIPVTIMIIIYYRIYLETQKRQKDLPKLQGISGKVGSDYMRCSSKSNTLSSEGGGEDGDDERGVGGSSTRSKGLKRDLSCAEFDDLEAFQAQINRNMSFKERLLACLGIDRDSDYLEESSTSDPSASPATSNVLSTAVVTSTALIYRPNGGAGGSASSSIRSRSDPHHHHHHHNHNKHQHPHKPEVTSVSYVMRTQCSVSSSMIPLLPVDSPSSQQPSPLTSPCSPDTSTTGTPSVACTPVSEESRGLTTSFSRSSRVTATTPLLESDRDFATLDEEEEDELGSHHCGSHGELRKSRPSLDDEDDEEEDPVWERQRGEKRVRTSDIVSYIDRNDNYDSDDANNDNDDNDDDRDRYRMYTVVIELPGDDDNGEDDVICKSPRYHNINSPERHINGNDDNNKDERNCSDCDNDDDDDDDDDRNVDKIRRINDENGDGKIRNDKIRRISDENDEEKIRNSVLDVSDDNDDEVIIDWNGKRTLEKRRRCSEGDDGLVRDWRGKNGVDETRGMNGGDRTCFSSPGSRGSGHGGDDDDDDDDVCGGHHVISMGKPSIRMTLDSISSDPFNDLSIDLIQKDPDSDDSLPIPSLHHHHNHQGSRNFEDDDDDTPIQQPPARPPTGTPALARRAHSNDTQKAAAQAKMAAKVAGRVRRQRAHSKVALRRSERKQDQKAAKTLTAILLAFLITWTPYNIFTLVEVFCKDCVPPTLYEIGKLSFFFSVNLR